MYKACITTSKGEKTVENISKISFSDFNGKTVEIKKDKIDSFNLTACVGFITFIGDSILTFRADDVFSVEFKH